MADATQTVTVSFSKGGVTCTTGAHSKSFDVNAASVDAGGFSQLIGSTAEALDLPADIAFTNGVDITIKNLDSTNFVYCYMDNGTNKICHIRPGKIAVLPDMQAVPYLNRDTADCLVYITAFESGASGA